MDYSFDYSTAADLGSASPILGGLAFLFSGVGLILLIAVYVYQAWAFMTIAQKTKTPNAWLAWIPVANVYLLSQMAKMHWWPVLLILIGWVPIIGQIGLIVLAVYSVIWMWKVAEARNRPGWWGLIITLGGIIPIVGSVLSAVFLGLLAWTEEK